MTIIVHQRKINYWKFALALAIGAYIFYCSQTPTFGHIIDWVDLVIHEAGHIIFIFFGSFIHALGGSLLQILVPFVFVLYFYSRMDLYATSVVGMWLGYNIVNVSVYMADAIRMQIPLLGGDEVIHDWNYLFTEIGLLSHVGWISNIVYGLGMMILIGSLIGSLWFAKSVATQVRGMSR